MAWLGIWFDGLAGDDGPRNPEQLQGLVRPIVYPFASAFLEEEGRRLETSRAPDRHARDGTSYGVYYSLDHDGGRGGVDAQGCRIVRWLFEGFSAEGASRRASRFNEIPLVVHCDDPVKAAAMVNALVLLRFLGAAEDQAVAKIMIHPWNVLRGGPSRAALDYERRVLELLHGQIFYGEDVTLFDVLDRPDLRRFRSLPPCCAEQIGFVRSILEWIDDCWPRSDAERDELTRKLRNSLADEARYLAPRTASGARKPRFV